MAASQLRVNGALAAGVVAQRPGAWSAGVAWGPGVWMATMLVFIGIVSAADLWLTLTYLTTGGMSEGNPVARWVIGLNSVWLLGLFKVGLVAFTCAVLWNARGRRSAQIAGVVGCLMMAWLCVRWHGYTTVIATEVAGLNEITEAPMWVRIEN